MASISIGLFAIASSAVMEESSAKDTALPSPSAAHVDVAAGAGRPAALVDDGASWPTRPIKIVVTFPPGGGTDLLARELGARLGPVLGQQVIVENHPGASGNIGAAAVAQARPDGYTLLMVNSSFAINPGVFRNLPFSPKADFTAVANVAWVPSLWVVPITSPWQTLHQALDEADRSPDGLPYASCGNGTPQHLAGEMIRQQARIALAQIPYRGCGPALADIMAGQVGWGVVAASSAAPYLGSRLRALATTAATRSQTLPDVPTVAEANLPGYAMNQWHGLLAPAGTPAAIVHRLNGAINHVVSQEDMQSKLRQLGYTPESSSPEAFDLLVKGDIDRYGLIAAQAGLRVD